MLKLKQYFCRHKFECLAYQAHTEENLWQCSKCKVYCIQHYGLGISYKCIVPNIGGWIKYGIKEDPLMKNWHIRKLKDFTLEDAMDAMDEGFYCICKDGKLGVLTNFEWEARSCT